MNIFEFFNIVSIIMIENAEEEKQRNKANGREITYY